MKGKFVVLFILSILIADQVLKFYIKANFFLGQEHRVFGDWFKLHFVENEGMAWGWALGGKWGKIVLTSFRLIAVIVGTFYIRKFVLQQKSLLFLAAVSLIYAGAAGNLIDSIFYGLIFNDSNLYMQNVAHLVPFGNGYASAFHGKVVDMLYFPIIKGVNYPTWFPFWGGQEFEFFSPVFNIADASISVGVGIMLLFQNKLFPTANTPAHTETV